MLDLELAAQLDLELDLQVDCEFGLEQDPTSMLLVGLTNFSANNYLATASGGGEAGVSTGFGVATLFQVTTLVGMSSNAPLADRSLGSAGYLQYSGANNALLIGCVNGAGAFISSPSRPFVASDVGKVFLHIGLHTGAGGFLRAYEGRTEVGAGTAIVGYTPAATAHQLSRSPQFANIPTPCTILAHVGFRGVPSLAQLQAFFDVTRARGDLPETMDGATVTHRWSGRDELLFAANPVGRKTYGARGFSDTAHLSTAGSSLPGVNTGFWCAHYCTQTMLSGGSSNGVLIGRRTESPSAGWEIYSATNGAQVVFYISQASGTPVQVIYNVTAADIGRPLLVLVLFDAALQKARLIINRTEVTQVTCTGYLAASGIPLRLGRHAVDAVTNNPADKSSWLGSAGGHASLTAGEIAQLFDDVERTGRIQSVTGKTDHLWDPTLDILANGGAMPATIADRIGTDTLTRTGTLEVASYVDTAPPAPAQLTDTQTRATADALLRVGTPAVRIIDPTIEGRRTLGALGFTDNGNYFTTVNPGGIAGALSGFWVGGYVSFGQVPSIVMQLFHREDATPVGGWQIQAAGSALRAVVYRGAGLFTTSSSYTVAAADVGRPMPVLMHMTGTVLRLYVNRVQVSSDVAVPGYVAANAAMQLGHWVTDQGSSQASVFGLAGGHANPSLAEIQQWFDDIERTGRMQSIPGKTDHLYDLTTDILASGVDAVPAQVLDRVGTDHLTRQGIDVRTDANSIRGVGPYGVADYWITAPGGGIPGASTGFHVVFDLWFTAVPVSDTIATGGFNGSAGWYLNCVAGALKWTVSTSPSLASSAYTITGADLNKRLRVIIQYTAAFKLQLFVQGVQAGADSTAFGATYTSSATSPMAIGATNVVASSFTGGYIEMVQGGHFVLTPAEIATLNADLTTAPPVIAGKTTKRYVLEQDIAAVSGTLPARSVERISGGDNLVRIGSPLVLAQRTERVWSYETSPIEHGANNWGSANYYTVPGGMVGAPAGFSVDLWFRIDSQAVASATRVLLAKRDAGIPGWHFQTGGTNTTLLVSVGGASTAASSPTAVLAAADVGKILHAKCVWDGAKVHLYIKRVEQGAGTSFAGPFVASSAACTVGRRVDGFPVDGITILGWGGGDSVHTLAEYQAQCDAFLATDQPAIVPGKYEHFYRFDAAGAGATVQDLIGTEHMTRQGSPTYAPIYARAAGW